MPIDKKDFTIVKMSFKDVMFHLLNNRVDTYDLENEIDEVFDKIGRVKYIEKKYASSNSVFMVIHFVDQNYYAKLKGQSDSDRCVEWSHLSKMFLVQPK